MKKLFLIVMYFLIVQITSLAQDSLPNRNFDIHIMPLTLLDYTPRLRLGFEYINNRIGHDIEIGVGYSYFPNWGLRNSVWDKSYKFFEIRYETKYYLSSFKNRAYLSSEFFYINLMSDLKNNYYYLNKSQKAYSYDSALFTKIKYGFHLKFGFRALYFDKMSIDFYSGLGIAKRITNFKNLVNPTLIQEPIFEEWFIPSYKYQKSIYLFHLTLGIKVGIEF